jgi:hypothetical protein
VTVTSATSAGVLLLLGGLGLVLLAPLAWRVLGGRFDPFEPIVVFAVAYGVMFLVRPLAMIVDDDFDYVRPTATIPVADAFPTLLAAALIGAAAFVGGYSVSLGRRIARRMAPPPARFDTGRIVAIACAAALIGVASFLAFLVFATRTVGVSGLALFFAGRSPALVEALRSAPGYLNHAPMLLIPASLVLLAVGHARRDRRLLLLGAAAGLLLVLRAAPGGNRIMLLPFAGGALVYWYATRQRRPGPVLLLFAMATALTGSAVLLAIRDAATRQETGVRGAVAAVLSDPAKILAPLTRGGDTEMAPALAAVMSAIPTEIPRTWGMAVFGDLVIRPIPRALWHDKPLAPREQVIATLWPAEYSTEGMKLANPEFSILLYFYLDFGLPGIAGGMALFGLGARVAYEYFRRFGATSTPVRLLFSLFVPFLVIALRDSPVDTIDKAAFIVLPLWLTFHAAAIAPRRRRTATVARRLARIPQWS